MRPLACVLTLSLLGFAGCGSSGGGTTGDGRLLPPPGTGGLVIDMDGDWEIVALENADDPSVALPYPDDGQGLCSFLPLQRGRTVVISDGAFRGALGQPLRLPTQPGPQDRYVNVVDGQVAWFELHQQSDVGCFSQLTISAAFGSVDADTMDGLVAIHELSSCPRPLFVTPDPNGLFRVRLQRTPPVTPPAGTGALAIAMDGEWRIDEIENVGPTGPAAPLPGVASVPCDFLPLQEGRWFTISDGRLWSPQMQEPLLRHLVTGDDERYENAADGQSLRFALFSHQSIALCTQSISVQAAFGSVDADTMEGFAVITTRGVPNCLPPALSLPRPWGMWRVLLRRR
ncbi:MAG: hypothetical protein H6838_17590 [Planctomycetes bacterium]|nr:hypothetical protein [Planctomycetota bacterium]MCB9887307.1 hypothetical protein [Planctomycetota bacterium]